MTDEELAKKAEETVKRYVCGDCNKCQSHGYIGCDVYKYSKDSFIAGAKAMQEENERLKAQIEKMKCCENCKLRGSECVALEYQGILCGKTRDKWELVE